MTYQQSGSPGIFHVLAIVSLATLAAGGSIVHTQVPKHLPVRRGPSSA